MHSIDKLTIDTPEQIALEFPLAGIGSRFLALTFDSLLQIVVLLVGILILVLLIPGFTMLGRYGALAPGIAFIFLPFCLYWGYFAFFEIIWEGQTPGKRHAGIRVIKETGRRMTAIEAIGRNLVRAIDMLPGVYAVGLVCMMLNKQNKRLGDYVAGTVVVHDKGPATLIPTLTSKGANAPSHPEITKISADELVLIETYLGRRYDLDPAVRYSTAQRIVAMIREKTGAEKAQGQSDDDFLEAVAQEVRDTARFR